MSSVSPMAMKAALESLTGILGRQPELPEWVFDGAILGIQGGTEKVIEKLEKSAKHGMKVAGVWCRIGKAPGQPLSANN